MESLLERMGVTYHWEGDVRIPDLVLSDTLTIMWANMDACATAT